MHIPELQGPPACVSDLLFKFSLHFTDLNTATVVIYGVHATHIKLSLGSPCCFYKHMQGRKSVMITGGMDYETRGPQ